MTVLTQDVKMQDLHSKLNLLQIYVAGIWLKKRYIMLSMWAVCLIGWAAVSAIPNKYESNAKIFTDTKSMLKPLLNGLAFQGDTDQEIQIIAKTLLSRPNLEDIARQTDLDIAYPTKEEYEKLLEGLKEQIVITGSTKTNVYDISYRSVDPEMAKKVVSFTMQKFVDATMGQNKADSDGATSFLSSQIREYEIRLEQKEKELADFKKLNQDILPSRGNDYYQTVTKLNESVEDINLYIKSKEAELYTLTSQFLPARGMGDENENLVSTPFDARIAKLKSELDTLKIRYTENHPDVIELGLLLKSLESNKSLAQDAILSQAANGAITPTTGDDGIVLQQFALKISTLKSELDGLRAKRSLIIDKLADLKAKLDLIPTIEAKLVKLTRDYDNVNKMYKDLVGRLESAELSRNAGENTSDVKFKVLEPPRAPIKPVGPNRMVMFVAVFLLASAIGFSVAFIASQVNSVISSPEHLKGIIQEGQFLGQVEDLNGDKKRKYTKWKLFIFAMMTLILLALLAGLVAHEMVYGQSLLMWIK